MKMIPRYLGLTVMIPLLLVIIVLYTPWTLFSNPIPQYLQSKILSPSQEAMQHKSISISSFFSSSPSFSPQKDPSSLPLLSLSQDRMNKDIVSVLIGPTLIDGTSDPPKSNAVIITKGNKIVAVTNETEFHDGYYYHSFIKNKTAAVNILNLTGKYVIPGLFDMHAHVAGVRKNSYNQNFSENTLKMLLDYGVTTIRNPGGPTNQSIA
ncbi:MAG: hypothetical protein ACJ705_10165, partial [Nitrososphaeraceae archaeon]